MVNWHPLATIWHPNWKVQVPTFVSWKIATVKTQYIPYMEHLGLFAWLFLDLDFLYGISSFCWSIYMMGKISGIQNWSPYLHNVSRNNILSKLWARWSSCCIVIFLLLHLMVFLQTKQRGCDWFVAFWSKDDHQLGNSNQRNMIWKFETFSLRTKLHRSSNLFS